MSIVIDNCDTLDRVTVSRGVASLDTVDRVEGVASVRVDADPTQTNFMTRMRTLISQIDWRGLSRLEFNIKEDGGGEFLLFIEAPNIYNRYIVNLRSLLGLGSVGQWTLASIPRESFAPYVGTPSWDNVGAIQLQKYHYGAVTGIRIDNVVRVDGGTGPTLNIQAAAGVTTTPVPGTYTFNYGQQVSVLAALADPTQPFHWELDGVDVGSANPIPLTMDVDHILAPVVEIPSPVNRHLRVSGNSISNGRLTDGGLDMSFTVTPTQPFDTDQPEGTYNLEMDEYGTDELGNPMQFNRYEDLLGNVISTSRLIQFDLVGADVDFFARYLMVEVETYSFTVQAQRRDLSPAAGATVRIRSGPMTPPEQVTDANGQTTFLNLVAGSYTFEVIYVPAPGEPAETATFTSNPSLTASVTVTVSPTVTPSVSLPLIGLSAAAVVGAVLYFGRKK